MTVRGRRALGAADVDPDAQRLLAHRPDALDDRAARPPHRWRQAPHPAEAIRVEQPEIERHEPAEGRTDDGARVGRTHGAIRPVDEWNQLLDQEPGVARRLTAAVARVRLEGVVLPSLRAVRDRHEDAGGDAPFADQPVRGLVSTPLEARQKAGGPVEHILAIVEVHHRVAFPRGLLVTGRQPDPDVARQHVLRGECDMVADVTRPGRGPGRSGLGLVSPLLDRDRGRVRATARGGAPIGPLAAVRGLLDRVPAAARDLVLEHGSSRQFQPALVAPVRTQREFESRPVPVAEPGLVARDPERRTGGGSGRRFDHERDRGRRRAAQSHPEQQQHPDAGRTEDAVHHHLLGRCPVGNACTLLR